MSQPLSQPMPSAGRGSSGIEALPIPVPIILRSQPSPATQPLWRLGPLCSQIEFYFSPQNLATDTYLLGLLNTPAHLGAVPIGVLCNFRKVRQINAMLYQIGHLPVSMTPPADPNLICLALQGSSVVRVSPDGFWVIPCDASLWNNNMTVSSTPETTEEASKLSSPVSPVSETTSSSHTPLQPIVSTASVKNDTATMPSSPCVKVLLSDVPSSVTDDEIRNVFSAQGFIPKRVIRLDRGNEFEMSDERFNAEEFSKKKWSVEFETNLDAMKVVANIQPSVYLRDIPLREMIEVVPSSTFTVSEMSDTKGTKPAQMGVKSSPIVVPSITMDYPTGIPAGYPVPTQLYVGGIPPYEYVLPMHSPVAVSLGPSPSYYPLGMEMGWGQAPTHLDGASYTHPSFSDNNYVGQHFDRHDNHYKNQTSKRCESRPRIYPIVQRHKSNQMYNVADKSSRSSDKNHNWQPKASINHKQAKRMARKNVCNKVDGGTCADLDRRQQGSNNRKQRNSQRQKQARRIQHEQYYKSQDIILSAEAFPALTGTDSEKKKAIEKPFIGGYAQALQRKVTPCASTEKHTHISSATANFTLDDAMNKLTVSEDGTEVTATNDEEW